MTKSVNIRQTTNAEWSAAADERTIEHVHRFFPPDASPSDLAASFMSQIRSMTAMAVHAMESDTYKESDYRPQELYDIIELLTRLYECEVYRRFGV